MPVDIDEAVARSLEGEIRSRDKTPAEVRVVAVDASVDDGDRDTVALTESLGLLQVEVGNVPLRVTNWIHSGDGWD